MTLPSGVIFKSLDLQFSSDADGVHLRRCDGEPLGEEKAKAVLNKLIEKLSLVGPHNGVEVR